jgi:hypothetical protein
MFLVAGLPLRRPNFNTFQIIKPLVERYGTGTDISTNTFFFSSKFNSTSDQSDINVENVFKRAENQNILGTLKINFLWKSESIQTECVLGFFECLKG